MCELPVLHFASVTDRSAILCWCLQNFQITSDLIKIFGMNFVIWKLIVFGSLFYCINWVIENCDDGSGKRRKKKKKGGESHRWVLWSLKSCAIFCAPGR